MWGRTQPIVGGPKLQSWAPKSEHSAVDKVIIRASEPYIRGSRKNICFPDWPIYHFDKQLGAPSVEPRCWGPWMVPFGLPNPLQLKMRAPELAPKEKKLLIGWMWAHWKDPCTILGTNEGSWAALVSLKRKRYDLDPVLGRLKGPIYNTNNKRGLYHPKMTLPLPLK